MAAFSSLMQSLGLDWWGRFGEPSGTALNDSSGNGHNGTWNGAVTLGTPSLIVGDTDTAVTLPGTATAFGQVSYGSWLNRVGGISFGVKFKTTNTGLTYLIQRWSDASSTLQVWGMDLSATDVLRVYVRTSGGGNAILSATVTGLRDGNPHLLAGDWDGATLRLYVDGKQVTSMGASGTLNAPTSGDMFIGQRGGTASGYYSGTLDEGWFGPSLTAAQHFDIFKASINATTGYANEVLTDSPLAYYRMDEASGTSLVDSSGNAHAGTIDPTVTLGATGLLAGDSNAAWALDAYEGGSVASASWMQPAFISMDAMIRLTAYNTAFNDITVIATRANVAASDSNAKSWIFFVSPTGQLGGKVWTGNSSGGTEVRSANGVIALNTTYHVAMTYGGGFITLCVNGTQVAQIAKSGNVNVGTRPLSIAKSETSRYTFAGTLDEYAFYGTTLSAARVTAHANIALSGGQSIPLGQAVTTNLAQPFSDNTQSIPLGQAVTTNLAQPIVGVASQSIPLGQAVTTNLAQPLIPPQWVDLGQASGSNTADVLRVVAFIPLDQALETGIAQILTPPVQILLGQCVETSSSITLSIGRALSASGSGQAAITTEALISDPVVDMNILDESLYRAPTSLTFTLTGAPAGSVVDLYIDADGTGPESPAWTGDVDSEGAIGATSVNVGETVLKGTHVLNAVIGGVLVATANFNLLRDPSLRPVFPGADAQAVVVPGAISHNTRHWVLQDLLAQTEGGIGSYILPANPKEMTSPHLEHGMNGRHTTAITGQFHIFQTGLVPKEWTFSGYCPTQEMQEKLLEYRHLNRRFYIIDHHNRAWKSVITNAEFVPRKRHSYNGEITDWGSDYTITVVSMDQNWVTPA